MANINEQFSHLIGNFDTQALADVEFAAYDLSDPVHLQRVNSWIASFLATPRVNPFWVVQDLKDRLLVCGIDFPLINRFGNSGKESFAVKQWGLPSPYKIDISWVHNKGLFTFEATLSVSASKEVKPITEEGTLTEAQCIEQMDEAAKAIKKHNYALKTSLGSGQSVYTHTQGHKIHVHADALHGFSFAASGPTYGVQTGRGMDSLTKHLNRVHKKNQRGAGLTKRNGKYA